jgi:hypothetical protein
MTASTECTTQPVSEHDQPASKHDHPASKHDPAGEHDRARGAGESVKPGVERSETPGLMFEKLSRARDAGDSIFN